MSVLVSYRVCDLHRTTVDLMNVLYNSEWKQEMDPNTSEDYYFRSIEHMHVKIMKDSEIAQYPKGSSMLYDVGNRLMTIENNLIGETDALPDAVTIRYLIERTNRLITSLSSRSREYLCVIC